LKGKRSKSREAALKVLYQIDITKDKPEKALAVFFKTQRFPISAQAFTASLVEGTASHLKEVDARLKEHASNWALDRMAVVDRNVLRLGVYELMFEQETPPKVAINEAVELAKRFGSADSSKFVNGVLDAIHKLMIQKEKTPSDPLKAPAGSSS
jgi:transcription antitermination factor NusB